MIKRRGFHGGVLVLVIAMLLVTVMVGVALVTVCRLVFTQRGATNSADAAVLNVAKQAGYNPTVNAVSIGTPEFAGLGDNHGNEISLLSYNNAVAKTIVVALSAEEEETPEARNAARHMKAQLDKLAAALVNAIRSSGKLEKAFDDMAMANSQKVQGSTVRRASTIEWSYYGPGEASSIYFDPESFDEETFAKLDRYLKKDGPRSPHGQYYLKGYEPVSFAGVTVEALPVFPGQQPHLISNADFERGKSQQHILPNSLLIKSSTDVQLLQTAAAVIGLSGTGQAAGMPGGNTITYPVEAPDAFIRFTNMKSIPVPAGEIVSDGSNDLFNKELFSPSRVTQSNNGVFTTDVAQMEAWVDYNVRGGPDPRKKFRIGRMRIGSGPNQRATLNDLLAIRSIDCECTHSMYAKSLTGRCRDSLMLRTWADNYRRWSVERPPNSNGVTALESMKLECLECRAKFSRRYGEPYFSGKDRSSGMKVFDDDKVYASPPYAVAFGTIGSPMQYLEQISRRKTIRMAKQTNKDESFFDRDTVPPRRAMQFIYQDARKIKPFATNDEIRSVLRSRTLPLGSELYLRNQNGNLVLTDSGPSTRAEGRKFTLASWFNIAGTILNSEGDAGYDDAPYSWTTSDGRPFDPTVTLLPGEDLGQGAGTNSHALGREHAYVRRGTAAGCLDEYTFGCIARPCELECPN